MICSKITQSPTGTPLEQKHFESQDEIVYKKSLIITASDAKRIYVAGNIYTSQGTLAAWKHMQQSGTAIVTPVEECRKLGNFDYRKQGMKKFALERADFAYGYFDGSGVHWTLTDAIGSIELVVSGDGRVEQHTGYYPYGQPWRAVAGQQRLFGGKELRTFGGLNDYDFHARFQNPAGPFFQSADRHAANDPARSPWTFAAANPVRFTDPTGLDIYSVDINGNVVQRIEADYDQIRIHDTPTCTEEYEKGSVIELLENSENCTFFKIKDSNLATEIFELFGDISSCEFAFIELETSSDSNESETTYYVSTGHEINQERSAGFLIEQVELDSNTIIKRDIHSHSINPEPSPKDYKVVNILRGRISTHETSFEIYYRGQYKQYGKSGI